jgi:hypothetical protein
LDARDEIPDDEVDTMVEAFRLFCLEAVRIKVPGKRIPLVLRDAQLDTVRRWMKYRYTISLKARQIGFSTLAASFSLWCAMGGSDRQIYMLSRKEKDSVSLLNKAKYAYKSMPGWVRDRAPGVLDRTKLTMTFDNDSFIESSPTASDPIRGETAFLVIVDEWAKFPNEEEAWASIEPVADLGGRIVGLGTANGEGKFFHRLWVGATNASNTFHPIFHPWSAIPERDDAWYEQKRRNMEPWQLHQEYPSNPEEAFIGSGNPFFDLEILRDMTPKEALRTIQIEATETGNRFETVAGGDFWIYQEPNPTHTYVVGADIAQGLDHGDWTVAYVMDAKSGEVCGVYRGKPAPDYFGNRILAGIGYMYNYALLAPEVNNHGLTTVKALQRRGYTRIYRRRTQMKRQVSPTETIGWLTTHGNKTDLVNGLSAWIRTHNIPHEHTIAEMKTFIRDQRGDRVRLHGSPHDDCVMALAITVEARQYAVKNKVGNVTPKMVGGSIEWWAEKLDKGRRGRKRRLNPVF